MSINLAPIQYCAASLLPKADQVTQVIGHLYHLFCRPLVDEYADHHGAVVPSGADPVTTRFQGWRFEPNCGAKTTSTVGGTSWTVSRHEASFRLRTPSLTLHRSPTLPSRRIADSTVRHGAFEEPRFPNPLASLAAFVTRVIALSSTSSDRKAIQLAGSRSAWRLAWCIYPHAAAEVISDSRGIGHGKSCAGKLSITLRSRVASYLLFVHASVCWKQE